MAEIYKIQTSAQGSMIPSQERVQLKNDAGKYLQEAAQEMNRIGQMIDERSNREATNSMKAASEQADNFVKDFNAFDSPTYQEDMVNGAMKIWDDAYNNMSRNQRVLFDDSNPSAREIYQVGVVRAANEKALNHEVDTKKVYNDQLSSQIAFDDNLNRHSPNHIKQRLTEEQNLYMSIPAFKNHPEKAQELVRDLYLKTVGGALDDAYSDGNWGYMETIMKDKELTKFFDARTKAAYNKHIQEVKDAEVKALKDGNTTSEAVSGAKNRYIDYATFMVNSARLQGKDINEAYDTYFRVLTQINSGVPLEKVNATDLNYLDGILGMTPDGKPITFVEFFKGMDSMALIMGAQKASSEILTAINPTYKSKIVNVDNAVASLFDDIDRELEAKSKNSDGTVNKTLFEKNQASFLAGKNLSVDRFYQLKKAYNSYQATALSLRPDQVEKKQKIEKVLTGYRNNFSAYMEVGMDQIVKSTSWFDGTRSYWGGANMTGAEAYKTRIDTTREGEESSLPDYFKAMTVNPTNLVGFANMSIDIMREIKGKEANMTLTPTQQKLIEEGGIAGDILLGLNGEKINYGKYSLKKRQGWDAIVDPTSRGLNMEDMPERGTVDYALLAVIGAVHADDSFNVKGYKELTEWQKKMGGGNNVVSEDALMDIYYSLREQFAPDRKSITAKIDIDSSVPARDTQTFKMLSKAYDMAGLHPTEDQLNVLTNSIRKSYHGAIWARGQKGLTSQTKRDILDRVSIK